MALLKLGGVEMPAPTKYNVKRSDLSLIHIYVYKRQV